MLNVATKFLSNQCRALRSERISSVRWHRVNLPDSAASTQTNTVARPAAVIVPVELLSPLRYFQPPSRSCRWSQYFMTADQ